MILDDLKKKKNSNGIIQLPDVDPSLEKVFSVYLKKDKRIYNDDEVKLLPYASQRNPHKSEWEIRTTSFLRLRDYLSKKSKRLNILDVGCGNGWLIGQLAKEFDHEYFGIDIVITELEKAARLFNRENVHFIHGDILTSSLPTDTFNLIILNSSLPYFKKLDRLLKELFLISKTYGEVHIIDTPFFSSNELMINKNKSLKHFTSIGVPEMASYYFHHSMDEFRYFRYELLFNPNTIKNRLTNYFFGKDSSFSWILVTR
ncbi:MAG: class I SAM-dependent methyltransferase [Ignavibacterium sp.]|jgi:ubiquinone/menaquinone biosynthesis C-methylase UbiE|nr:class I SAM-dependent methyltransferase [Ignavibacterium sp.]